MQFKTKFIAAVIPIALMAMLILAVPGVVVAQNPDLSQNPAPDQATMPSQDQSQGQYQSQDQGQYITPEQDQEQDMRSMPSGSDNNSGTPMSNSPYDQASPNDQNERPPMSELPPPMKPSPNGPSMQGPPPGPGGQNYPGGQGNSSETSSNNGVARVSLIHGDVSTRRGDAGEWSAAQLNAPLMAGDSVSTGDKSRVELQLDYANIFRLAEHTQANVTNLTRSQIQIQMGHGMANYTVLRNSDADAEIDTPNVSIRTERREASFRILVTADDNTEILVRRGEVEITTPQGGTRVGANQFITIKGTGADTQYRIGDAPARDDWDQWNSDRDRMINGSVSRKNTNDYYTGTQDLDANGSWQDVPDYGHAWFPNEPQGWAPYSAGNWVWEPYWGWTWVSNEPWGWAPYHYGRWFEYNGAWGWYPGPVYPYYRPLWAPAYVSFFGFGGGFGVGFGWGSIGWFPIGPCDYFHPWWGGWRGRFGYTDWHGWNRGGFAPLHGGSRFSNVNRAMHDRNFRGATSVAANRFGQGRAPFSRVNHESLQNAHFATGNLPVTPTRASLSASGRPAAGSTLVNRGGSHFFSPRGTNTVAGGRSFEHEQSQVSNAMRQNGVSPVNGGQRGFENGNRSSENGARGAENGARGETFNRRNSVESNRQVARPGNSPNEGRGFGQSAGNGGRATAETRGNSNWGSVPRPGNSVNSEAGRQGGANSGGWQKFSPMQPRSSSPSSEGSAGRTYGNGSEGRSYGNGSESRSYGGQENRGSYGAPRGTEERGSYGAPRYPGSEQRGSVGRTYGGGGVSRPQLNMRQPIVTPRSYGGGYPGGGRAPSSGGGRAPSFGGGRAPSSGGGHSAPSGHSGGSSHGGAVAFTWWRWFARRWRRARTPLTIFRALPRIAAERLKRSLSSQRGTQKLRVPPFFLFPSFLLEPPAGCVLCTPSAPHDSKSSPPVREFQVGEACPFAVFVFLLHQPFPRVLLGRPAKRRVERAIRVLEDKTDRVAVASAIPRSFREARSEHIEQMEHVALADGIVPKKPDGFVLVLASRSARGCLLVDANKLVIEHPLRFDFMMCITAHDRPLHLPGSGHVIGQVVAPFGRSLRDGSDRHRKRNE